MGGIEHHRANAFRQILQSVDQSVDRKGKNKHLGSVQRQREFLRDLIKQHNLQIGKDNGIVETPDADALRKLIMEFLTRNNKGSHGSDVFTKGSAIFPAHKLKSIEYKKPPSSVKATPRPPTKATPDNEIKTSVAAGNPGNGMMEDASSARPGKIPPLRLLNSKSRSFGSDTKSPELEPKSEQNTAIEKEDTAPTLAATSLIHSMSETAKIRSKRQLEEAPLEQNGTKRPRTGKEAVVEHAAEPSPKGAPVPILSPLSTPSTSKSETTSFKDAIDEASSEQTIVEQHKPGEDSVNEATREPAVAAGMLKVYPWHAPPVSDAECYKDILFHVGQVIGSLKSLFDLPQDGTIFPAPADPSPALQALFTLAIGRKGHAWEVAYREASLAKEQISTFLVSVLCASFHKEVFAKPVPWQTPKQTLEGMGLYASEASRFNGDDTERLIYTAGANMIRAPLEDIKGGLHEEIIDPLAEKLGERLHTIVREIFQAQIDARAKDTTANPKDDESTWTDVAENLHLAFKSAIILRGLWECTPTKMDMTWVQPGTRFDVKTMEAKFGWSPGKLGVTEPFEVTASLLPLVTSESQPTWRKRECWMRAMVHIKKLPMEQA